MSAADGYVMSSAWEGMPIVLLEAAAAGLPIVATRVGGNPEVVRENESGFLVPPRDSEALAAAMMRLIALPDAERRSLGERDASTCGLRYGLSRVVDRWLEVYRRVLERKGITPGATNSGRSADSSA